MLMVQVVERCRSCDSDELRWVSDPGWLTHGWRYLRCQRCQDCVRTHVPASTWIMYLIALAAALAGWWSVTG
jgi:hypothetical protein